jgi:hypothetical protein
VRAQAIETAFNRLPGGAAALHLATSGVKGGRLEIFFKNFSSRSQKSLIEDEKSLC